MNITKPISKKDWLKALGVKGDADKQLCADMDEAEKLLLEAASPKGIYKVIEKDKMKILGFSMKKHLEGCHKVAVMGVTLGGAMDNLIRRKQVVDMSMAVILDSGASVLIEQLCDEFEVMIKSKVEEFTTSRFSPGYGDSPLQMQADIVRLIDGQRKIGLNVTGDSLMIPRKSVTAVIGLSDHEVKGRLATCDECVLKDKCTLIKEGKTCGD